MWTHDLMAYFGAAPQWPNATPERYVPRLQAAGLEIVEVQEWSGKLRFTDVGAIVYYLKCVPWEVPRLLRRHPPGGAVRPAGTAGGDG